MFQTKEVSFQVHHPAGQMGQTGQTTKTENLLDGSPLPIGSATKKEILSANMLPGISPRGDLITVFMPKTEFGSQICSKIQIKNEIEAKNIIIGE